MKKHLEKTALCVILALLMAVLSPLQTFAASQKQYISEIRMADSAEKLESLGYSVLNQDLNAGTSWYDASNAETISRDTYIGFKTTTDPTEAITDISVMDMNGGYSFGDYEQMLERQKKAVQEQVFIYRDAINEFCDRYTEGSMAAKLALTSLNNYIEDDSGRLIGDMFLDPALSDEDLVKMFMQGTILINTAISECLAIGLSNDNSENWLDRLSKVESVSDDYYDDAVLLLHQAQSTSDTIQKYQDFGVDLNDDAALQEFFETSNDTEIQEFVDGMTLYKTLSAHPYKAGTAADLFLNPDLTYEDLYPLISVMTPGQIAIAKLNGFETLIKTADLTDEAWETSQTEYNEVCAVAYTDEAVTEEKISIYTGIDRTMYEGGVALTSDAKRKSASTGDNSWYYGNINQYAEYTLIALGGIAALTTIGTLASALIVRSILQSATVVVNSMRSQMVCSIAERKAMDTVAALRGVVPALSVVAMVSFAILFITAAVYLGLEIQNYYHPSYSEVPLILMDLKFSEDDEAGDWEKYVRYDVVRDENGDAGDLNAWMAKQWNAMYTTKDRSAGDPISADSLMSKFGESATPRGFSPVHYFGQSDAFDLNTHCFNNEVDGIFVFFQRDSSAFASEAASVLSGGALAAVTGIGGLLFGAFGALLVTKKKKKPAEEMA